MNVVQEGIETRALNSQGLPLVVDASAQRPQLIDWVGDHIEWIEKTIVEQGAILFRNFCLLDPLADFGAFSKIMSGELLEYVYRSTPRSAVCKNIYTATEYPANAVIPQHNENAYSRDWPVVRKNSPSLGYHLILVM